MACARCGTLWCDDCLSGPPGARRCPRCAALPPVPWDRRRELGLFRAFFSTLVALLRSPRATVEAADPDGRLGDSLLFGALAYALGFLPSLAFYGAILGPRLAGLPPAERFQGLSGPALAALAIALLAALGFALLLGQLVIVACIEWLALRLLGAREASVTRAVRAHAFSAAAFALGLVPLVGPPVATFCAAGLRVLAVRRFQRVSLGRAALAVAAPLAFLCVGAAVGAWALVALVAPAIR